MLDSILQYELDLYKKAYDDLYDKYINTLDEAVRLMFKREGMEYEKSKPEKTSKEYLREFERKTYIKKSKIV